MRLATWNVNSIRARQERVIAWIERTQPDVVCLQELKCEAPQLAEIGLERLGYEVAASCQRTYNGVAILSRVPLEDVTRGLEDEEEPVPQARLVAATVNGVRVISVYVPNGQAVGSDKYEYKLRFLRRMLAYLQRRHDPSRPIAICGDFNVAPEARDVHDPREWESRTLFHASSRAELQRLMAWGLADAYRLRHDEPGRYSWWDYRLLGFPKDRGLRIDLVLVTRSLAERVTGASIDREERKGTGASDHAPVIVELSDPR